MRFLPILSILFLWCQATLAQQSLSDSLQKQLTTPVPDTTRVLLLDQLSRSLMYSEPVVAMRYAQEGLAVAQKVNYQRGEARIQNRIGTIFRLTGSYSRSLEAHLASVAIAQTIHDTDALARTYNNLGNLYSEQKNTPKAIDYYQQTAQFATRLNDLGLKRIALSNIGSEYALQNQLDSALAYTRTAYQSALSLKAKDSQIELMVLANIYKRMGRNELALRYYRTSIPVSMAVKNDRTLSQTYLEMAQVFQATTRPDSAIVYAEKSLQLAQSSQMLTNVFRAGTLLSDLYQPTAPRQSLAYLRMAQVAKDSVASAEKVRNFQTVEFNEQIRRQEIQQSQAELQSKIITYTLLGSMVMVIVIAFMLYRNNRQQQEANRLLAQQQTETNRQRDKAEEILAELRAAQTQLIQKEKLASLGELMAGIAHEIQNPLNFVNNFSGVSADLITELNEEQQKPDRDPELEAELLGDLKLNLQKITHHGNRASSIVRGMLEHSRTSTGEKRPTNLNALADEYLKIAYQGLRQSGAGTNKTNPANPFTCELITDFDSAVGEVDLVPQEVGRVLLNLFNNAFYAVRQKQATLPPHYQPTVRVSTRRVVASPENLSATEQPAGLGATTGDVIEIRVLDDGTGISDAVRAKIFQPFFTTKPTGEGTGLGLSLSYDIITKGYGGSIRVESTEGSGTEFVVQLPTSPASA